MSLKSFIDVSPDSHFPIQNLPFGMFQPRGGKPRAGVAIGDLIVDLSVLEELGHFRSPEFQGRKPFSEESLNAFLALGRPAWRKARAVLQRLLSSKTPILRDDKRLRARVFHTQKGRSHIRLGSNERLERSRYSGVGVPTTWAVLGKEFLHQHLTMGGNVGGARAFSETAPEAGSRADAILASKG